MAARVLGTKIPPYWLMNRISVTEVSGNDFGELDAWSDEELADAIRTNANGVPMCMSVEIRPNGGDWWLLPLEPLVSITGKNVIVKRTVAKGKNRGSIKERWCQDDYEIKIEGALIDLTREAYPKEDVKRLRDCCEAATWEVRGPLFEIYNITRVVVERYEMPFTAGVQNQGYTITAYSDDTYKLLLGRNGGGAD